MAINELKEELFKKEPVKLLKILGIIAATVQFCFAISAVKSFIQGGYFKTCVVFVLVYAFIVLVFAPFILYKFLFEIKSYPRNNVLQELYFSLIFL